MNDVDGSMWEIVQTEIGHLLEREGITEEEAIIEILKITNGLIAQDDIRREILRQKRMVEN